MAKTTSRSLSGIAGFFDDLDAGADPKAERDSRQDAKRKSTSQPEVSPRKANERKSSQRDSAKPTTTRHRLPTGRPPGKKDGEGPHRAKASLWIDAELLDAYRERVYVERRHLSEIVEDALREFRRSAW